MFCILDIFYQALHKTKYLFATEKIKYMCVQNIFLITFSLAMAELRTFMATSISIKMKVKIVR